MSFRRLFWILLAATLGVALWWAQGPPPWAARLSSELGLPAVAVPAAAEPAKAAAVRRCMGATGIVYTDGECPPGTRAERLERGSLTVLPAPPQPAGPAAASAVAPLRRLAGPDESAAQRERVLDQALHR